MGEDQVLYFVRRVVLSLQYQGFAVWEAEKVVFMNGFDQETAVTAGRQRYSGKGNSGSHNSGGMEEKQEVYSPVISRYSAQPAWSQEVLFPATTFSVTFSQA